MFEKICLLNLNSASHPAKAVKGWVFVFFFVSIRIFRIREFSEFEILGILKFGEF